MVGYFFNLNCKGNYFYLYIFMAHKKTTFADVMFAEVFLFSNFKASGCARKGMAFFYTQKQVADLKKLPF